MGTVLVFTAERSKQIEDTTVVAGSIVGDELMLTRRDGVQIDAGNVRGPKGDTGSPGGLDAPSQQLVSPTGMIVMFGGATAPTGWVFCDGASYLRTSLANLFNVLGVAFGSVDSTHFNVPDLRQRFPMGQAALAPGNILGGVGGSKDLVVPLHTHNHSHVISSDGLHKHAADGDTGNRWIITYPSVTTQFLVPSASGNIPVAITDIDSDGNHAHGGATATSAVASGVDPSLKNLPPYQVVNYIIRY